MNQGARNIPKCDESGMRTKNSDGLRTPFLPSAMPRKKSAVSGNVHASVRTTHIHTPTHTHTHIYTHTHTHSDQGTTKHNNGERTFKLAQPLQQD